MTNNGSGSEKSRPELISRTDNFAVDPATAASLAARGRLARIMLKITFVVRRRVQTTAGPKGRRSRELFESDESAFNRADAHRHHHPASARLIHPDRGKM